jgi:RimJ/RimL family protein N-acetyltransferase
MVHYMQLCSIAVCPPSGVAFEYLCTKGSLYLYQIADNQKDVKKYLLEEQLAFDLEKDFPAAPDRVTAALKAQQIYFHGKSGQYLLNKFKRLEQEIYLQPKRASINAMMQYFEWANAPEVRKSAFNSAPIPLENHQAWFYKKIDDPDALLLYFEYKGEPLGQVRLELKEQEWAQISYSIDPNYYGNGFGTQVLKLTLLYALEHNFAQCFYGEVKAYNIASLKVFRKLAFDEVYVEEEEKYVYRINLAAPNNLY